MLRDVEEVARAQVPVAPGVAGIEAVGVEREDHPPLVVVADLEPALDALEAACDGGEAPHAGDAELGARRRGIELPARAGELLGVLCGMRDAHALTTNGGRGWGHLRVHFGDAAAQEAA